MIKTLRITSLLAVILAGVILFFPAFIGLRTKSDAEQVLSLPSVVEQFEKSRGETEKERSRRDSVSPLVKQAEAFALYLNPPIRQAPPGDSSARPAVAPRPQAVSPKFTLVGTSFNPSTPELSLAFIDEPGRGLRWVRQSSQIGYLVIEQIKDGSVVIKDDTGSYELAVERGFAGMSLIEDQQTEPFSEPPSGPPPVFDALRGPRTVPTGAVAGRPVPGLPGRHEAAVGSPPPEPQLNDEEQRSLSELVEKLRELRNGTRSEKTGQPSSPEDHNALMEKLISDFRASRISSEEADTLSNLGEQLRTVEQDMNKPRTLPRRPGSIVRPSRRPGQ